MSETRHESYGIGEDERVVKCGSVGYLTGNLEPRTGNDPITTSIKDIRYALRTLILHPEFVARMVSTVTLGIGADRAVFRRHHRHDHQAKGQGIDQGCCHPSRQIASEEAKNMKSVDEQAPQADRPLPHEISEK